MSNTKNPLEVLSFSLKSSINIGFIALTSSAFAIAIFIAMPEHRNTIIFACSVVAASATVASTFYIGRGLRLTIESEEKTRTLEFIRRWNSSEYFYAKRHLRSILKPVENSPYKEKFRAVDTHLNNGPENLNEQSNRHNFHQNIVDILNFLEEICLSIESKFVDEEILKKYFKGILINNYDLLNPWIQRRRQETNDPELYIYLEDTCRKWRNSGQRER